jgi:cytoskeletal protein RodZ
VASPAPAGGGRKILGLKPKTAMIAGGAILLGAIAYFYWRSKQAAKNAPTSASASASASSYANQAQLDALQQELNELLTSSASVSAGSGGGAATGTGTGTNTGTGTTTAPGPPGVQPGGPIQTTTPPATTTTAPPAPASKAGPPPMPSGVHATKVTATSITIAWTRSAGATFYPIRVTYQGKLVRSSGTAGTTATIFGLTPDHTYTVHVKAQGPGGVSSETNGPAVKTAL